MYRSPLRKESNEEKMRAFQTRTRVALLCVSMMDSGERGCGSSEVSASLSAAVQHVGRGCGH